jgi:glycosyltransferase involved in cell wall biosynthesis
MKKNGLNMLFQQNKYRISIALATRNKAYFLKRTIESIARQEPPFSFELIIADDGSDDNTREIVESFENCKKLNLKYVFLENNKYRTPSWARNASYKIATGEIMIIQSDEVIHGKKDTIKQLAKLKKDTFNIATVYDTKVDKNCNPVGGKILYTGKTERRPLFFLGSILREYVYAIGGNSLRFPEPCCEDIWFADCLIKGQSLKPEFRSDILGYHQTHCRPSYKGRCSKMRKVLNNLRSKAQKNPNLYIGEGKWETGY